MSKRIIVRRLLESDLRSMIELWKISGLPYRPRGRDRIESLRAQRGRAPDLFLGAYVEGALVGAVIASDDGRRGWINRLAVVPSARRRGVAKVLIRHAEDALRKRGRRLFCVHVEIGNEGSIRMLEESGYTREKEILYFTKRERKTY